MITGVHASEQDFESVEWISAHIGVNAVSVDLMPLIDAGGLCGTMRKITVASTSSTISYILKFTAASTITRSKTLGLAREAFFYNEFGNKFADILPSVRFAYGNMETGEKAILMADLSSSYIQSGYYFGSCSPHNWHKDLKTVTGATEGDDRRVLTYKITLKAFESAAKIHAAFWNDKSILQQSWIRGSDWIKGEGKEKWLSSQNTALDAWRRAAAKIASGESKINWNPNLIACMESSFNKISWEEYQIALQSPEFVFSLVHGDYHPANMMWKLADESNEDSLILLDWEAVGVGSGPQDCAQYVISHMYPAERRIWENDLISSYHSALVAYGVNSRLYCYEKCKADYVAGGAARWVWLLALLSGMCPDNWVQYFHDQLSAFIEDHGITPNNIEMPRV